MTRSTVRENENVAASRDRRSGGEWTRRQAAKNFLIACGVRAAFILSDLLPRRVLLVLGRILGRTLRSTLPGEVRRARESAARCMTEEQADQVSSGCFERVGENLATSLLLRRRGTRALDWVDVPETSRRTLAEALSEGRGAVFISAHVGPFELVPAAIAELGVRPAIVVRESYDPRLDPWVDHHRHARGIDVIHRGRPGAAVRIVRALRAGQPVGFLPDLGGRVPQIATNFLGRRTGFALGPQQIAQRMRAPIVVGTLRRLPGPGPRHSLSIERVETAGSLAELTQRVAHVLERAILDAGDDFPWMAPSPGTVESSDAGEEEPASARPRRDSRIAAAREKALDLSTTCSSEGGSTWDKGSEASRA